MLNINLFNSKNNIFQLLFDEAKNKQGNSSSFEQFPMHVPVIELIVPVRVITF